jgi:hypothetical protein
LFWTMRSQDRDVVLVGRTIDLGCWAFGMGREWAGDGKGEVSLRATWGLAEVESASYFLSPLISNPLISPTESGR